MKYLLLLAFLLIPATTQAVWFDSAFYNRVKVEIVPSKVGTSTAIVNFPVYVNLADLSTDFWRYVRTDGADIRVAESDETTETAFELVTINAASSTGELHFLADSLSTTSTSTFYIYYGNADASAYASTSAYGSRNVWNSSYKAVYHLNESANDTAGTFRDSTANNRHITGNSLTSTSTVAGKLAGNGVYFDGSADYINMVAGTLSLSTATTAQTIQMWANLATTSDRNNPLITGRNSGDGDPIFSIHTGYNGDHNADTDTLSGFVRDDGGAGIIVSTGASDAVDGTWKMIHLARNTSKNRTTYLNGASQVSTTDTMTGALTTNIEAIGAERAWIAASYATAAYRYMHGTADEVRVLSTSTSLAWVQTEFNNQSTSSSFYQLGSYATSSSWYDESWNYRVRIDVRPHKVGTTTAVTNIPVYVNLADMPAGFWTNVQADGDDIRVTERNRVTETAYELVSIDTGASTGELHFLADTLSSVGTSSFYLYYGNATATAYAATDTYGRNAVWASYMMVHHFNMASGTSTDATGKGNDAAGVNSPNYRTTGKLGYAMGTTDSTDRYFKVTASTSNDINTTGYQVDMWLNASSSQSNWFTVLSRGAGGNNDWSFQRNDGSADWRVYHTNVNSTTFTSQLTPYLGTGYQKLTFVYDTAQSPDKGELYSNGIYKTGGDLLGAPSNTAGRDVWIGTDRSATVSLQGSMDELRIHTLNRAASWILTEFNNQSTTTEFYLLNTPESDPSGVGGGGATSTATSTDSGIIWFW
jgi:hypothetical protein